LQNYEPFLGKAAQNQRSAFTIADRIRSLENTLMNRELLVALAVGIAVFAGMAHAEISAQSPIKPRAAHVAVVSHHRHVSLFSRVAR
jgi:hypothetical protein